MTNVEPEDFAQVTVVPSKAAWLLAGTTAEVETTEFLVTKHWQTDSFMLAAERDGRSIKVTVRREAFEEFLARLTDLAR